MKNSVALHKNVLIACVFAAILFGIYQFYPDISQLISWGIMLTIGKVAPPLSMAFLSAGPWIVAFALCGAIAIIYWLMGVRNAFMASSLGFSISYFLISLFVALVNIPIFGCIVIGSLAAYLLFIGTCWIGSKITLHKVILGLVGIVLLVLSLYFTPSVTVSIRIQRDTASQQNMFKQAVNSMNFTPYYPTYSSAAFAASSPQLKGYRSDEYQNEIVIFQLGNAEVTQSKILSGQEKVMNFTTNCDIVAIKTSMRWGTSIMQHDIDRSLESPQRCTPLQTPNGNKVYFKVNGQWTNFYTNINQTNVIIEFDDINGKKFEPGTQDELLKVIDSLQPLDKQKLKDGEGY